MSKVLLVYEDYSEMMHIESVLKKVGFDVLAITNEFTMSQQILAFNPDIVVGYGKGPKVSTIGVGRRLKEMPRWTGKAVLIFPGGIKPDPLELARSRMDMALEAPIDINRLLQVLANFTQQDPQALVERMMKAVAQESQVQKAANAAAAAPASDATTAPRSGMNLGAKDDGPVLVSGTREQVESWNVKGSRELDEFNRMMGLSSATPTAPAGAVAPSPATPSAPGDKMAGKAAPGAAEASALQARSKLADPETDSQFVTGSGFPEADPTLVDGVRRQMDEANAKIAQKMKGYERFLTEMIPAGKVGLKRTEVKRAQRELSKDWTEEKLKSQDEARREFTNALFKKKD